MYNNVDTFSNFVTFCVPYIQRKKLKKKLEKTWKKVRWGQHGTKKRFAIFFAKRRTTDFFLWSTRKNESSFEVFLFFTNPFFSWSTRGKMGNSFAVHELLFRRYFIIDLKINKLIRNIDWNSESLMWLIFGLWGPVSSSSWLSSNASITLIQNGDEKWLPPMLLIYINFL